MFLQRRSTGCPAAVLRSNMNLCGEVTLVMANAVFGSAGSISIVVIIIYFS
jgi:hypothetical protein